MFPRQKSGLSQKDAKIAFNTISYTSFDTMRPDSIICGKVNEASARNSI